MTRISAAHLARGHIAKIAIAAGAVFVILIIIQPLIRPNHALAHAGGLLGGGRAGLAEETGTGAARWAADTVRTLEGQAATLQWPPGPRRLRRARGHPGADVMVRGRIAGIAIAAGAVFAILIIIGAAAGGWVVRRRGRFEPLGGGRAGLAEETGTGEERWAADAVRTLEGQAAAVVVGEVVWAGCLPSRHAAQLLGELLAGLSGAAPRG